MNSDQEFWHFQKNAEPKIDIVVYGINSAKGLLRLLHKSEYNFWVVKGDSDPMPVPLAKSQLIQAIKASLAPESTSESTTNKFKKVAYSGIDRRRHKRILLKVNVILVRDKNMFSAVTVDISQGGMKLQVEVPKEFLYQVVKVFVTSPMDNLNVNFEATILESKSNSTRLKFGAMSDISKLEFANFLDAKLQLS